MEEKRLIDANALVPYLWALFKFFGSLPCSEADKATQRGIKRCIGEIKKMPTVDAVEVVHGEWIRCLDVDDCEYIECPICSDEFYDGDNDTFDKPFNYCPNCGAKMDGDGNDRTGKERNHRGSRKKA